ncbi:uncharacterized protein N0V89_010586 [Didymosphaeria variabile]|uniref:Uncharacterized protein n=1 Tax=Didymosphaeria variabile TaxID=1932322 RepID=A0A9W9C5M7_9PLEO|nr:uncharacterized protein N0V89_010586 [Didymosphaeria variabile]KAJ4346655.1 hypothetical protein N0V89_010586 [Didymosphaeria variabile]
MKEFRQRAQSRLRNLPVEIRLKIYEQMTPPVVSRLLDWRGLFLSCRLFHYEMKHELLRNMIKYLNRIQKDWVKVHAAPLQICIPTSITSIEKLSVAIPNSYFRAREAQFPAARIFSATLLSLLQLGISQLTIGRYEDDDKMKRTTSPVTEHSLADFVRDLLDLMDPSKPARAIKTDDGTELVVSRGSAVERIAFEWGTFDGALGDEDLVLPYYASDCPDDRTTEFVRGHICAPATGVVWTRRRYTWYGQVLGDFWHESSSLPE